MGPVNKSAMAPLSPNFTPLSSDIMEAQRFRMLRQVMLEAYMAEEARKAFDDFVGALRHLHDLQPPQRNARSTHTAWIHGLR